MQTQTQKRNQVKLYTMCGSKPSEVTELFAGDIGAIGKLTNTRTGDTLSVKGNTGILRKNRLFCTIYIYEVSRKE